MSKRAGTVVTIEDLVDAIGVDAARYALARYSTDSQIDLDLDLWTKRTNDNPVFYVQYAHARISSILRNAADLGLAPESHPELLTHEKEGELLRALAEFPRVVKAAAELREPHRVARYLEELGPHLSPVLRQLPGAAAGRRGGQRPPPGPAAARRGDPHRARPTGSTCSASPRRSGCRADARTRGRLGPRRRVASAGRRGCASPPTSTRWSRSCGRRPRARSTGSSRSAASG